ncbi:MAG: PAS domain S-box protein, partial [Candidatus Hodarchaeota archaeon]
GFCGIARDITERKQAEDEIKESEKKYRELVENINEVLYRVDENGVIVYISSPITSILEYSPSEIVGRPFLEFVYSEDKLKIIEGYQSAAAGHFKAREYRLLTKSGDLRWILASSKPVFDGREFLGLRGVLSDITERKNTEQRMQRTQQQLQDMFDNTPAAVYAMDLEGQYIFVNRVWRERAGMNEREVIGKTRRELFPYLPESYFPFSSIEKQVIKSGKAVQFEELGHTTGNIYLATKFLLRDESNTAYALCNSSKDITELKQAEKMIRENERKLRAFVEQSRDGITLTDEQGCIIEWNNAQAQISQITPSEALGRKIWEIQYQLLPNENKTDKRFEQLKSSVLECLEGSYAPWLNRLGDFLIEHSSGSKRFVQQLPFRIKSNKGYMLCSILRDLTDYKLAEQAAQRAQQQLQDMFDNTPAAVYAMDLEGRYIFVNREWRERAGMSEREVIGKMNHELFPHLPESHPFMSPDKQVLESGIDMQIEEIGLTTGRVYLATKFLLRDENRNVYALCNSSIDITQRKQAEEAVNQIKLQEERYHTMMGHFVKNDLQKIVFSLEDIKARSGTYIEEIENVIEISLRSSKTIDTVNKIFAVLQSSSDQFQESLNLLDVIQKAVSNLQSNFTFLNSVTIDLESLDIDIMSDEYLKDVFSEILMFILSSSDGKVVIEGRPLSSQFCTTIYDHSSQPIPKKVCVRLAEKISDKWEAQGHFIGISLASVIMQHYGGHLTIQPGEDQGNVFQLFFPLDLVQFKKG